MRYKLVLHKEKLPGWLKAFSDWEKHIVQAIDDSNHRLEKQKETLLYLKSLLPELKVRKQVFLDLHKSLKKKKISSLDIDILQKQVKQVKMFPFYLKFQQDCNLIVQANQDKTHNLILKSISEFHNNLIRSLAVDDPSTINHGSGEKLLSMHNEWLEKLNTLIREQDKELSRDLEELNVKFKDILDNYPYNEKP